MDLTDNLNVLGQKSMVELLLGHLATSRYTIHPPSCHGRYLGGERGGGIVPQTVGEGAIRVGASIRDNTASSRMNLYSSTSPVQ